jgi:hypothetical protein
MPALGWRIPGYIKKGRHKNFLLFFFWRIPGYIKKGRYKNLFFGGERLDHQNRTKHLLLPGKVFFFVL